MQGDPLTNISWDIRDPSRKAKIIINGMGKPISKDRWKQVILPANNFTITYPFARYNEINPTILYETEGEPVTLEDLLATIYEFYQEPIPTNEMEELIQEDSDLYDKIFAHRIDVMLGLIWFEGLRTIGSNKYRLVLGS